MMEWYVNCETALPERHFAWESHDILVTRTSFSRDNTCNKKNPYALYTFEMLTAFVVAVEHRVFKKKVTRNIKMSLGCAHRITGQPTDSCFSGCAS